MEIANQNLRRYREAGFDKVEGWCAPVLFYVIDLLDAATMNKQGGVCEIGVHHGKFYLLLNQVSSPDARSYAIDVFDQQVLNVDHSGLGNRAKFEQHLTKYDAHQGRNTTIIAADSTDTGVQLSSLIKPGSIRFFSVDGSHTVEHTIYDLQTANMLTHNEGVVILDDFTNANWLGVMEGAMRFLSTKPTLVPFAVGGNKMLLCKLAYQQAYFELISRWRLRIRTSFFFGFPVCIFKSNVP
jgi:hypothetical protein